MYNKYVPSSHGSMIKSMNWSNLSVFLDYVCMCPCEIDHTIENINQKDVWKSQIRLSHCGHLYGFQTPLALFVLPLSFESDRNELKEILMG